jgi:hypothetical protein
MNRVFHLSLVIKRELENCKHVHALHSRIAIANANAPVRGDIHPQALARLAHQPHKVRLSLHNLIALDNYLAPLGEGLHDRPLFDRQGIIECLVERPSVLFLVGAKPRERERRNDLSPWDTRAAAELVGQIYRRSANAHYEIQDVLLRPNLKLAELRSDSWYAALEDPTRSIVSIGSSRANLASEVMLARMFREEAFATPAREVVAKRSLPFCFLWPQKLLRGYRSAFASTVESVAGVDPAVRQLLKQQASGFLQGKILKPIPRNAKRYESYAVVVAQRQATGQVWVVICGESGPVTYAAAKRIGEIQEPLPQSTPARPEVLWMPLSATIRFDAASLGDRRSVEPAKFAGEVEIWPEPRDRRRNPPGP